MENTYGLFFPIVLDEGAPVPPGLADAVDASLRHILSYIYGKRFFNPAFGTRLHYQVGKGSTDDALYMIKMDLNEAISRWEPRIEGLKISVKGEGSSVNILIEGILRAVKEEYTFQTTLS